MVCTGLKRNVGRCAAGCISRLSKRHGFGMWAAAIGGPPTANHAFVLRDDHAPYGRIRRYASQSTPGEPKRMLHMAGVVHSSRGGLIPVAALHFAD